MLAWAVLYSVMIRQPMVCGDNVHGSPNVTFHCYQTTGESHFVEFTDLAKAQKFESNLAPYNYMHDLDHGVPDNQRFIEGLELHTFKKIKGIWKDVTPPFDYYRVNWANRRDNSRPE